MSIRPPAPTHPDDVYFNVKLTNNPNSNYEVNYDGKLPYNNQANYVPANSNFIRRNPIINQSERYLLTIERLVLNLNLYGYNYFNPNGNKSLVYYIGLAQYDDSTTSWVVKKTLLSTIPSSSWTTTGSPVYINSVIKTLNSDLDGLVKDGGFPIGTPIAPRFEYDETKQLINLYTDTTDMPAGTRYITSDAISGTTYSPNDGDTIIVMGYTLWQLLRGFISYPLKRFDNTYILKNWSDSNSLNLAAFILPENKSTNVITSSDTGFNSNFFPSQFSNGLKTTQEYKTFNFWTLTKYLRISVSSGQFRPEEYSTNSISYLTGNQSTNADFFQSVIDFEIDTDDLVNRNGLIEYLPTQYRYIDLQSTGAIYNIAVSVSLSDGSDFLVPIYLHPFEFIDIKFGFIRKGRLYESELAHYKLEQNYLRGKF